MVQNVHNDDIGQRCLRVWTILIGCAIVRQTIPYPDLARDADVDLVLLANGNLLRPIGRYCVRQQLPRLDVLAVGQHTGVPGHGYSGDPAQDTEPVWDYDWRLVPHPEPNDFA